MIKVFIKEIRIHSNWIGWGSKESNLIIKRTPDGFYGNGKKIEEKDVDDLINAVNEPVWPKPDCEKLSITQLWLKEKKKDLDFNLWSPAQEALFLEHFMNLEIIHAQLENYFKHASWTDDYPTFTLDIIGEEASIRVKSISQLIFMIPWNISIKDQTYETYNSNISKAMLKLLPKDFVNSNRFDLSNLINEIRQRIGGLIGVEWNKLDVEKQIGDKILPITQEFGLKDTKIACIYSVDLDGIEGWHTTLTHDSWPSNISLGLYIQYKNKELGSIQPILDSAHELIQFILSIDWFSDYLKKNQDISVEVRFVRNKSMSNYLTQKIMEEFRYKDKFLVQEIKKHEKTAIFIEIHEGKVGFSRWIVFPDKRMLLWHFQGNTVLKWNLDHFDTWETYGFNRAGTFISANGEIEE